MDVDVEKFGSIPLFVGLERDEIWKILKLAESITPSVGDEIVKQGDPGDGFYLISAGSYEVRKDGAEQMVLARLEEQSFFGEMSLVTDEPRSASVVCVEEGRLKKVPVDKFNQLLEDGDLIAYKIVHNMSRILAQRLARLENRIVN